MLSMNAPLYSIAMIIYDEDNRLQTIPDDAGYLLHTKLPAVNCKLWGRRDPSKTLTDFHHRQPVKHVRGLVPSRPWRLQRWHLLRRCQRIVRKQNSDLNLPTDQPILPHRIWFIKTDFSGRRTSKIPKLAVPGHTRVTVFPFTRRVARKLTCLCDNDVLWPEKVSKTSPKPCVCNLARRLFRDAGVQTRDLDSACDLTEAGQLLC